MTCDFLDTLYLCEKCAYYVVTGRCIFYFCNMNCQELIIDYDASKVKSVPTTLYCQDIVLALLQKSWNFFYFEQCVTILCEFYFCLYCDVLMSYDVLIRKFVYNWEFREL